MELDNLRRFARDYGAVSIMDSTGKVRKLFHEEPDIWDLIQKADAFHHAGAWYRRVDFEKMLDTMKKKPGNVSQIRITEV
jgi:hypothetical protein